MTWKIPIISSEPLAIQLHTQSRVYLLGPNGFGKSALIQHLANHPIGRPVQRITAHRRTWLSSGTIDFTPASRKRWAKENRRYERQPDSRWREHDPQSRQSAILFDLVSQDNARARSIAQCVDDQNWDGAQDLASTTPSPFKTLNALLSLGTLPITVRNSQGEQISAAHRDSGTLYDIAKMSDGERSAVILAAHVLTAAPNTVFAIDEPERHLHRSITEPFLSAVFSARPDCAFVIATHDIALPVADPEAIVLIVRSCQWNNELATSWSLDILQPNSPLPVELRRTLLGSRRRILFVDGTRTSLDCRLYQVLFPNVSVVPVGSGREVVANVKGLRSVQTHHHVRAFGAIDRDDRGSSSVQALAEDGIHVIDASSVEGLYYCQEALQAVACRQARALELDGAEISANARMRALCVLGDEQTLRQMAARRVERRIRDRVRRELPSWRCLLAGGLDNVSIDIQEPLSRELDHYRALLSRGDLDGILIRYPVRKSGALGEIAKAVHCQSRRDYCRMVVSQIRADRSLRDEVRGRMASLANAVNGGEIA